LAKRRAHVSLKRDPALEASRGSIGREKLVYVLISDKKLSYKVGRSRIAYIGTTKKGLARVAQSVATKADEILGNRGILKLHARIVTCRPRQRVKMWLKLERALLLEFREMYDEVPKWNSHGKKMKVVDEFEYFSKSRVRRIIEDLS